MFIVAPLAGKSLFSLFSTHPPTEERIRRLLV
jgi:heat shock protein HtpX